MSSKGLGEMFEGILQTSPLPPYPCLWISSLNFWEVWSTSIAKIKFVGIDCWLWFGLALQTSLKEKKATKSWIFKCQLYNYLLPCYHSYLIISLNTGTRKKFSFSFLCYQPRRCKVGFHIGGEIPPSIGYPEISDTRCNKVKKCNLVL